MNAVPIFDATVFSIHALLGVVGGESANGDSSARGSAMCAFTCIAVGHVIGIANASAKPGHRPDADGICANAEPYGSGLGLLWQNQSHASGFSRHNDY